MCKGTDEGIVQYAVRRSAFTKVFVVLRGFRESQDSLLFHLLNAVVDSRRFAVLFVPKCPEQVIGNQKS